MSCPAQPPAEASGHRRPTYGNPVQLRLPLCVEQPIVDLTDRQTEKVEELDRGHREYHDRVVDQRTHDFFDDLDRQHRVHADR
jgi:hypothetical protein